MAKKKSSQKNRPGRTTPRKERNEVTDLVREHIDPRAPSAVPLREMMRELLDSEGFEAARPMIPNATPFIHDTDERPAFDGDLRGKDAYDALISIHDHFVRKTGDLVQGLGTAEWLFWLRRLRGQFAIVNNNPSTEPYVQQVAEALVTQTVRKSESILDSEHNYAIDENKLHLLAGLHAVATEVYELHSLIKRCGKGQSIRFTPKQLPTWVPDPALDAAIKRYDRRTREDEAGYFAALGIVSAPTTFEGVQLPLGGHVPLWGSTDSASLRTFTMPDPPPYLPESINLDPIQALHPGEPLDESQVALIALLSACYAAIGAPPRENAGQRMTSMVQWGYALLHTEGTIIPNLESTVEEMLRNPGAALASSPQLHSATEVLDVLSTLSSEIYSPLAGNPVHPVGVWSLIDLVGASRRLMRTLTRPRTGNVRPWTEQFERDVQAIVDQSPWRPDDNVRDGLVGRNIDRNDGSELTDIDAVAMRGDRLLLISCKSYPLTREEQRGDFRIVPTQLNRASEALTKWNSVVDYVRRNPRALGVELPPDIEIDGCVVAPFVPYNTDPDGERRVFGTFPVLLSASELERALQQRP